MTQHLTTGCTPPSGLCCLKGRLGGSVPYDPMPTCVGRFGNEKSNKLLMDLPTGGGTMLKRLLIEAKSGRMTRTIHVNGHVLMILPPFLAVVVRRVPIPRDWSTILVFPGYEIDQSRIDVPEVDPDFAMATLILLFQLGIRLA